MTQTFVQTVYIRSNNWAAFRRGEWAEITAMEIVEPGLSPARLCYMVTFQDGVNDSWPVYNDDAEYEFRTNLYTVEQPR